MLVCVCVYKWCVCGGWGRPGRRSLWAPVGTPTLILTPLQHTFPPTVCAKLQGTTPLGFIHLVFTREREERERWRGREREEREGGRGRESKERGIGVE